jgi:hypothetical protein
MCLLTDEGKHMTNILSTLKITAAAKPRTQPEIVRRRDKLLRRLVEQRELASANLAGRQYAPLRLRAIKDADTGVNALKEVPIRVKQWWWTGEQGELLLSVRYGSKVLELAKGKCAIAVPDTKSLPNVIESLIAAVKEGELDMQIQSASKRLRDGFKKMP